MGCLELRRYAHLRWTPRDRRGRGPLEGEALPAYSDTAQRLRNRPGCRRTRWTRLPLFLFLRAFKVSACSGLDGVAPSPNVRTVRKALCCVSRYATDRLQAWTI